MMTYDWPVIGFKVLTSDKAAEGWKTYYAIPYITSIVVFVLKVFLFPQKVKK